MAVVSGGEAVDARCVWGAMRAKLLDGVGENKLAETGPKLELWRDGRGKFVRGHPALPGGGRPRGSGTSEELRRRARAYVDAKLAPQIQAAIDRFAEKLMQRADAGDIRAAKQLLDLLSRR